VDPHEPAQQAVARSAAFSVAPVMDWTKTA